MENKDPMLLSFVNIANTTSLEIGVTLSVNGTVVSGNLISYTSYLKLLAEEFKGKGNVADVFSQSFIDTATQAERVLNEMEDDEIKPANYLHLKEATIFNGQQTKIGLWRCSISSVNGFTFGILQNS